MDRLVVGITTLSMRINATGMVSGCAEPGYSGEIRHC